MNTTPEAVHPSHRENRLLVLLSNLFSKEWWRGIGGAFADGLEGNQEYETDDK